MKNFTFPFGGRSIRVRNASQEDVGKGNDGDYLGDLKMIRIGERHDIEYARFETFCHELGHCWMKCSGLFNYLPKKIEEMFVESFAFFFAPILWPYFKEKFQDEEE